MQNLIKRNSGPNRRTVTDGKTLAEKLAVQREQRDLEAARDRRRRELFARQDEIQAKRDGLIDALELQLEQQVSTQTLLHCEWAMQ